MSAACNWPGDSPCNRPHCPSCGGDARCGNDLCLVCHDDQPVVLDLDAEEQEALASVPTVVLDVLAAGNEASLIGALARARHGGVRS